MDQPGALLAAGKLNEAIDAAAAAVKAAPKDLPARWLLAELLILAGQHERADTQLDTLVGLEPRAAVAAAPIRQLLRAEAARRQFYDEGRVPELLDGADQQVRDRLEISVLLRAGQRSAAGAIAERAEVARPALPGRLVNASGEEMRFGDMRDLDDVTAEVFEIYTQNGKYYWIEMRRVKLVEFTAPSRPLDLVWRRARMVVPEVFDTDVFVPAVYGTLTGSDDASRLGRRTEWLGGAGEAIVGVGRRSLVVDGDQEVDMLGIGTLRFGD